MRGIQESVHHGKVDSSGRVALPAAARERLAIKAGDELVIREDGEGLHLLTLGQAVERLQRLFAHIPPEVSLVDELVAERRAEAARE